MSSTNNVSVNPLSGRQLEVIHYELPEFIPVHQRFPDWPQCEQVISAHMPERFEFAVYLDNPSEPTIKRDFFTKMMKDTPASQANALTQLVEATFNASLSVIPPNAFNGFINQELTVQSLQQMNEVIGVIDQQRKAIGEPTTIEVLHHLIGLAPYNDALKWLVQ